MFRITSRIQGDEYVLKLEGCLTGPWVRELDACWQEARTTTEGRRIRIDLEDVWHVDAAGRQLMALMYRAGARFVARGCFMPEVVKEIAESADASRRN